MSHYRSNLGFYTLGPNHFWYHVLGHPCDRRNTRSNHNPSTKGRSWASMDSGNEIGVPKLLVQLRYGSGKGVKFFTTLIEFRGGVACGWFS